MTAIDKLNERLKNKEWITDDDLRDAVLEAGVENVIFEVPMYKFSTLNHTNVICKIVEGFNRMVKDNYKWDFHPIEPSDDIPSHTEYYVLDLVGDVRKGIVKLMNKGE